MKSKPKFEFVVEYVNDVEAAKRFYTDVLGLKPQRVHPAFVQFEGLAITSDQAMDGRAQREVYWLVDDIDAAWNEISPRAEIALPVTEKAFGKVFGVRGPSGEPLYLLQYSSQRPSQVVA